MKKVAIIFLVCIYSVATMGFTIKQFYCCGILKSITLSVSQDSNLKCDKGSGDGCCNNKYQFFKVKDKHISAGNISCPDNYFTDLHSYYPSFTITAFAVQQTSLAHSNHSPPLQSGVSLYIYNCTFRI